MKYLFLLSSLIWLPHEAHGQDLRGKMDPALTEKFTATLNVALKRFVRPNEVLSQIKSNRLSCTWLRDIELSGIQGLDNFLCPVTPVETDDLFCDCHLNMAKNIDGQTKRDFEKAKDALSKSAMNAVLAKWVHEYKTIIEKFKDVEKPGLLCRPAIMLRQITRDIEEERDCAKNTSDLFRNAITGVIGEETWEQIKKNKNEKITDEELDSIEPVVNQAIDDMYWVPGIMRNGQRKLSCLQGVAAIDPSTSSTRSGWSIQTEGKSLDSLCEAQSAKLRAIACGKNLPLANKRILRLATDRMYSDGTLPGPDDCAKREKSVELIRTCFNINTVICEMDVKAIPRIDVFQDWQRPISRARSSRENQSMSTDSTGTEDARIDLARNSRYNDEQCNGYSEWVYNTACKGLTGKKLFMCTSQENLGNRWRAETTEGQQSKSVQTVKNWNEMSKEQQNEARGNRSFFYNSKGELNFKKAKDDPYADMMGVTPSPTQKSDSSSSIETTGPTVDKKSQSTPVAQVPVPYVPAVAPTPSSEGEASAQIKELDRQIEQKVERKNTLEREIEAAAQKTGGTTTVNNETSDEIDELSDQIAELRQKRKDLEKRMAELQKEYNVADGGKPRETQKQDEFYYPRAAQGSGQTGFGSFENNLAQAAQTANLSNPDQTMTRLMKEQRFGGAELSEARAAAVSRNLILNRDVSESDADVFKGVILTIKKNDNTPVSEQEILSNLTQEMKAEMKDGNWYPVEVFPVGSKPGDVPTYYLVSRQGDKFVVKTKDQLKANDKLRKQVEKLSSSYVSLYKSLRFILETKGL